MSDIHHGAPLARLPDTLRQRYLACKDEADFAQLAFALIVEIERTAVGRRCNFCEMGVHPVRPCPLFE